MNLSAHPELLDRIAAGYALGSLRAGARRRFETMAREQPPVRAAALLWQSRLLSMTELQPAQPPSAAVWTRIDNLMQAEADQQRMEAARAGSAAAESPRWLRALAFWRTLSAAGALATVLAVVSAVNIQQRAGVDLQDLQAKLQSTPQVAYVAVLSDEQSKASMLVTFDPRQRTLTLQRVGNFQEAADRSLQLWALPPSGGPRSLGVLGTDKLLRLTAAEGDVREVPTLAISLEPKGGVPGAGGPTGPVVFKGALIQKQS